MKRQALIRTLFLCGVILMLSGVGRPASLLAAESKVSKELEKIAREARADRAKRDKEIMKRREQLRKEREKTQQEADKKARKKREKYEKEVEKVRKEARKSAEKSGASAAEIERRIAEAVRDYELQRYELAFRAAQAVETLREMQRKDAARKKVMWVEWNGKKIPATVFQPRR